MKSSLLRSMRFQTSAIVIVGLLLSHLIGYLIYTDNRNNALLVTEAIDIAERAAGVSRLLRDLPADWRLDVEEASDSRAFRVWTTSTAAFVNSDGSEIEEDVAAYLDSQLPRLSGREMYVRLDTLDKIGIAPPNRLNQPMAHYTTNGGRVFTSTDNRILLISLNHKDGEWLNFLGHFNTPPSFLPELLGASIASAILAIALIAFWLVSRVTAPLDRLSNAAERFGQHIYTEPLSETGPYEVATAAAAFNRMQKRLTRLIESRTELLAAISHDLRTPITQMKLRTDLMPDGFDKSKTLSALDEMETIIGTFLDYARASNEAEECIRTDIGALVESLCNDMEDAGEDISCSASAGLVLSCKRVAIRRCVRNLIDNAVKFGGAVDVKVARSGSELRILVADNGPGIPEEMLEEVFAPFHRGENSRNKATGGIGLGLSIAQAIAEDHGGQIILKNRREGGLTAELILPYLDQKQEQKFNVT